MDKIRETYNEMITESKTGKMLAAHIKTKIEKQVDDMVDTAGDLISNEFEKDSAEFKKFDELTKRLYDTLAELKQLFIKV